MANPASVQEAIRNALILVGAIGQDEQPSASEAQDALNWLLKMMDSWSADSIDIYTVQRSIWPLGTKQVMTAGPGGDWDMPYAPPKIEEAYCQITSTEPPSEIPLDVLTAQEWAAIPVKGTPSTIPRKLWCDAQWPLANISLFPVPQGQNNIVLYMWQQLTGLFSSLTDNIVFPPGYALGIVFNLALILAPTYGKTLSDDIKGQALMYKSRFERKNLRPQILQCDNATLARPAVFNWLTGQPQ